VVKNKVSPPFMEAEFDIIYGQGINWEGDLIAVGLAKEIIQKKGAWLQFEGEMIGQGKEASRKALQDEPALAQKILAKIKGETVEEPPAEEEPAEEPAEEAEPSVAED
jgi:recombination protein RecA